MTKLTNLFLPFQIGNIELKNRIIMLSMDTGYGDDGLVKKENRPWIHCIVSL
jgi:2,4-dienoyl-CoA reductase-like NADH-dependent reductase (Old Yellow Enzyme family)